MLPDDATVVSVDDHVVEHPRVWPDRLPLRPGSHDIGSRLADTDAVRRPSQLFRAHVAGCSASGQAGSGRRRAVRFAA